VVPEVGQGVTIVYLFRPRKPKQANPISAMIQARCNARSPPRSTFTNRTGPVKISARMGHNSLGRGCERSALFFTGFICTSC
jgi:hypothetical protein